MATKKNPGKKSSPKLGRADRPGPKARRARAYLVRLARKKKTILRSNGKAFLDAWTLKRFAGGFARWHKTEV